jgi:hypothetical protein
VKILKFFLSPFWDESPIQRVALDSELLQIHAAQHMLLTGTPAKTFLSQLLNNFSDTANRWR